MQKTKPTPKQKPAAQAVASAMPHGVPQQTIQFGLQQQQQVFQGPIPHPDVMKGYESLMPGLADRIVKMAEAQAAHRQDQEAKALEANISAQNKNLEITDNQSMSVFRSDLLGQICGVLVSLSCVAGAVLLALNGREGPAAVLAAIPTAAVIKAFFVQRNSSAQQQQVPPTK